MQFLSNLFIKLTSDFKGEDAFGNKYYESKRVNRSFNRKARYIVFSGEVEQSKTPANWFNWLHYQCDNIPQNNNKKYSWERKHQPNLSGTKHAYYPDGHTLGDKQNIKKTYTSWSPN